MGMFNSLGRCSPAVTVFILPNPLNIDQLLVRVDMDGTHVVCAPILAPEPLRASGTKTWEHGDAQGPTNGHKLLACEGFS
jgi:hypothetical protein